MFTQTFITHAIIFECVFRIDCTAEKFWLLNRHGTRLPTVGEVEGFIALNNVYFGFIRNWIKFRFTIRFEFQLRNEIVYNHEVKRNLFWSTDSTNDCWESAEEPNVGNLCTKDYDLIKHWKLDPNIAVEHGSFLAEQVIFLFYDSVSLLSLEFLENFTAISLLFRWCCQANWKYGLKQPMERNFFKQFFEMPFCRVFPSCYLLDLCIVMYQS